MWSLFYDMWWRRCSFLTFTKIRQRKIFFLTRRTTAEIQIKISKGEIDGLICGRQEVFGRSSCPGDYPVFEKMSEILSLIWYCSLAGRMFIHAFLYLYTCSKWDVFFNIAVDYLRIFNIFVNWKQLSNRPMTASKSFQHMHIFCM